MAKKSTGIEVRHARTCTQPADHKPNARCTPAYRASVWSRRDGKKIRRTFASRHEAELWRADAFGAVKRNKLRASTGTTLREAATEWEAGAESGAIRSRNGEPYKPSALRSYRAALNLRVLPEFGPRKLTDISTGDLQAFVERMQGEGLDGSTIRNMLMPLRAIFRRACRPGGELAANPTLGLELPKVTGRRDRIAAPDEAAQLLAALPQSERAIWACAVYAGLRLGELQALTWENVDLGNGLLHVGRAWDEKASVYIAPKSRAGKRKVPIIAELRDQLTAHKARTHSSGLVFGRTETLPFSTSTTERRSKRAWAAENTRRTRENAARDEDDQLELLNPIGLHECRHTFASILVAAGVNAKALSTYLGHSSISITLDRYGHLMPGNETEAVLLIDAYLERVNTKARVAQVERGPVVGQ